MTNVVVLCLVAMSPSAMWHLDSTWSFLSISGHLGSWAAVGVCGWSCSLYLIVGIGHHVVVVLGGIVVWWLWWLMEERKNVTCCDIRVMFKLTREIRWIFSHDNHIFAVNTPSPGPSLAEVKFSPQGWPQSCWAQPWLSYQFNMAILPLKSTSHRGTIKNSQCQPHNLVCHQHQEMVRMTMTMTHLWQGKW